MDNILYFDKCYCCGSKLYIKKYITIYDPCSCEYKYESGMQEWGWEGTFLYKRIRYYLNEYGEVSKASSVKPLFKIDKECNILIIKLENLLLLR
ncbi:MAG: hypothetical protein LC122_12110 [Chitinophagales bacterium]|nr:hypothetical protein [Chitinophagales bacterium]